MLIEIGKTGWRTGVRSGQAADRLYEAMSLNADCMTFSGIAAFEGHAEVGHEAEKFLTGVASLAESMGERISEPN